MRKDPPARPPPITNVNSNNNSVKINNNKPLLTEESVTLRNPANMSKLLTPFFTI